MICSTGRACLGILLVGRISGQWHELEESMRWRKAQQQQLHIQYWYRDGMNECLCRYSFVFVVVVPLYGPWDGVVVQDVSKKMGAPSGFRYIAVFYLLANTGTTLDRGTNCKVLAGSLLWISHHMRSCVTKLAVLAMLASTGSIPRNTDEYRWQYSQYFQN